MIHKVAVLGDSIMRGVVLDEASGRYVRLEKSAVAIASKETGIDVQNFASFGMTSEKGLQVARDRIDGGAGHEAALICFGGNDVDHKWSEIAQHPQGDNPPNVYCDKFVDNMVEIVETSRAHGVEPVLLTLPPINSDRFFNFFCKKYDDAGNIIRWLGNIEEIHESHRKYSEKIEIVAKNVKCSIIDVRSAFLGFGDYRKLLCMDGIHPNAAGHELMGRVLMDFVKHAKMKYL